MTEYIVQAILIERTWRGEAETVVNSLRTTDYQQALDYLMKKHKVSSSYLYIAMEVATQEIVFKSKENKYA